MGHPCSPTINFTPTLKTSANTIAFIFFHSISGYNKIFFLKHVHLSTLRYHGYWGLLKGHHTLSVLRLLNGKEMDKKEEWKGAILAAGQVKIKGLMWQVVIRCQLQALFPLYASALDKKTSDEVGAPPDWPVLEVGVILQVAQPGLPYCLSQLIMVSGWKHSHQNFIERHHFICNFNTC